MERLPYRASSHAEKYDGVRSIPVSVLLENVRSLYNVGSFFRTADAAGIEALHLCGITGYPPKSAISKTALGAEQTVPWQQHLDSIEAAQLIRSGGSQLVAIETTPRAVDLWDWTPRFPVCVMFGHEVEGLSPRLSEQADVHVRIPMLGIKHSLNVATAGGIVLFELLRRYQSLFTR